MKPKLAEGEGKEISESGDQRKRHETHAIITSIPF